MWCLWSLKETARRRLLSRRQTVVAQPTAEAEYITAREAALEGQGVKNVIENIPGFAAKVSMGVDNATSLKMITKPTFTRTTRHIARKYHYVRDLAAQGELQVFKVASGVNPADMLAKPLAQEPLTQFATMVGMKNVNTCTVR